MEGRGYTVMDSTSHNETCYHNESIPFCAPLIVIRETYHGARTHYVTLRSTTGDYHPPVHLSGYLAVLRRMHRVARGNGHAAPQPLTLTPLSGTHTMTHIRAYCPYRQNVVAYLTARPPAQCQRCLQLIEDKGGSQGEWRRQTRKPQKPTRGHRRTLHARSGHRLDLPLWSFGHETHAQCLPCYRADHPAEAQGLSAPVQSASPAQTWASARPSRADGPISDLRHTARRVLPTSMHQQFQQVFSHLRELRRQGGATAGRQLLHQPHTTSASSEALFFPMGWRCSHEGFYLYDVPA